MQAVRIGSLVIYGKIMLLIETEDCMQEEKCLPAYSDAAMLFQKYLKTKEGLEHYLP